MFFFRYHWWWGETLQTWLSTIKPERNQRFSTRTSPKTQRTTWHGHVWVSHLRHVFVPFIWHPDGFVEMRKHSAFSRLFGPLFGPLIFVSSQAAATCCLSGPNAAFHLATAAVSVMISFFRVGMRPIFHVTFPPSHLQEQVLISLIWLHLLCSIPAKGLQYGSSMFSWLWKWSWGSKCCNPEGTLRTTTKSSFFGKNMNNHIGILMFLNCPVPG